MIQAAQTWWKRWQITIAFLLIAASFAFAWAIVEHEAKQRTDSVCRSITQVKNAALELTVPASKRGVTDPETLARIDAANQARAAARKRLTQALACRKN